MKNRFRCGLESLLPAASRRLAAIALAAALGMGAPDVFAQQAQEPAPAPQQEEAPQGEAAPAEGAITERRFTDWTVHCGRRTGQGPQMCEMQQQTVDEEGRTVMAVAVGELPGTSDLGLLILLPLRVLLPAGVTLQVDGGADTPLQVDWCERQGCRIEMLLEPDLLNRLKAGTKATVVFDALDEERQRRRLAYPISLLGFSAALNEVTG
jgi:invasion protein IalB